MSPPASLAQELARYVVSARFLRPAQITARCGMLLRRKLLHRWPPYRNRYAGPLRTRVTPLAFGDATEAGPSVDGLKAGRFRFLNRTVELGRPVDWFPREESQLWVYNLHYFDYGATLARDYARTGDPSTFATFRDLVDDWIEHCPPARAPAWDPYPISLRLRNWIEAYSRFQPALREDAAFARAISESIQAQARFLAHNLEYHLLNNHLLENGRALLLAGKFFSGREAASWRRTGERILWDGLRQQVLPDGGHFERSPMYHQIMLELYRDVVGLLEADGQRVPPHVSEAVSGMEEWLAAVLHPDGEIPLFNDCALGIARPASELVASDGEPSGFRALPSSGYFTFRDSESASLLIMDCGPLGPDFQPGHGHCDALSYELSVRGTRMIVDSGVGDYYGDLAQRQYDRSTRAHNTVQVDGEEQSEIWGRFRVARRAHPLGVEWRDEGASLCWVTGAHTGYRRLRGQVTHRRWISWIDRRCWIVCDRIGGDGVHLLENLIHLHPEVEIVEPVAPGNAGRVRRNDAALTILPWGSDDVSTARGQADPLQGWYAPEFGLRHASTTWSLQRRAELPIWMGYLLWPDSAGVELAVIEEDVQRLGIEVRCPDTTYRVIHEPAGVRLEKPS